MTNAEATTPTMSRAWARQIGATRTHGARMEELIDGLHLLWTQPIVRVSWADFDI